MLETTDHRPDPDQLLAQVQHEEEHLTHGRLKVFLGYAAGVGKTYAMLEAAHQRRAEGVDVVIGYLETHGRRETEALARDLETIPRQQVTYHDATLPEMDLDAVLARRPQLVLVDELAHTNAPGSRHNKRHLDVAEIRSAGIAVYTTLNIQHVESLNDVVAQITGVTVREKVPDSVLDEADEIELIDLPPQELVQRLNEGKVYVPDQAARAIQKFFRLGNLTALREVAMRRAAERIDGQMRAYMHTRAISGPWPATDRLLVCVSPSPGSERLIHAARRMASQLNAEWFALYVETPDDAKLSQAAHARLAHYLQLAQDLGAKVRTLPGPSVAAMVIQYARKHNVTKIIAGKPLRPRWQELFKGSVVDQIIRRSHDIDIYVITGSATTPKPEEVFNLRPQRPWWRYAAGVLLVLAVTLLARPLAASITPASLVTLYLAAEVIAASYLGRGPSVLAAILGVLAFDFFYVSPQLSFAVGDSQYILTFIGLGLVGIIISSLVDRVRNQAQSAERREVQAVELAELSRDLSAATDINAITQTFLAHVSESFGRQAAMLLPENGHLKMCASSAGLELEPNELAVADWVFKHGQPAGHDSDTLPAAAYRYMPLKTSQVVFGVLCLSPTDPTGPLAPDQRRLLEIFVDQAALAIERAQLVDHVQQVEILQATKKLQDALLNSISHELRTPLVAITGALSSLQDDAPGLDAATRRAMAANGYAEAERLNRLVSNLLGMTRIEAGALAMHTDLCDIEEVIGTALERAAPQLADHEITITTPPGQTEALMDYALIVQVLHNLLDNAAKYSPPGSPITVNIQETADQLQIAVTDHGSGVPNDDLQRVFDKFYRVHRPDNVTGTGLGLSICKGIVEAHHGRIWAANEPGGGFTVAFTLPLARVNEPEALAPNNH
jgi:two-component system, OmpR family, sensor histidine kinase KdpD